MWGLLILGIFITIVGVVTLYTGIKDSVPVDEDGKPLSKGTKLFRAVLILVMGLVAVAFSITTL